MYTSPSTPVTPAASAPEASAGSPVASLVQLVLGISALLAVLVAAFTWPAISSAPREVPIGIVAPEPAIAQLEEQLASQVPAGEEPAFALTSYPDQDAAQQAVMARESYGAIVLGPGGGEMLIASAASPAVAAALTQVAGVVPAQAGGPLEVSDLAPLPADDPRGVGLASSLFPILLGGMVSGIASAFVLHTPRQRLVAVGSVGVVGGLLIVAILQGWLGALTGSYWANAGAVALGIAAIGATLVGLHRVLGRAGIGLGAALMMLLGNPLSGVTSAPEMLPAGWGALGQMLPPGAAGSLLRSTSFFDGAGAWLPILVLSCWLVAGATLAVLPRRER